MLIQEEIRINIETGATGWMLLDAHAEGTFALDEAR
jgi:hypothetical protein